MWRIWNKVLAGSVMCLLLLSGCYTTETGDKCLVGLCPEPEESIPEPDVPMSILLGAVVMGGMMGIGAIIAYAIKAEREDKAALTRAFHAAMASKSPEESEAYWEQDAERQAQRQRSEQEAKQRIMDTMAGVRAVSKAFRSRNPAD